MKKLLVSIAIGLLLVVAAANTSFAAPAEKELPLKGTIQALESYTLNFPIMSVTANGSGIATQLGSFTVSYTVQVNVVTSAGSGAVVQLVAANGDKLFAGGTGQATATGTPGVFNVIERYDISGGTGRFAGAGGSITLNRMVNVNTGVTSGTMSGKIVLP